MAKKKENKENVVFLTVEELYKLKEEVNKMYAQDHGDGNGLLADRNLDKDNIMIKNINGTQHYYFDFKVSADMTEEINL